VPGVQVLKERTATKIRKQPPRRRRYEEGSVVGIQIEAGEMYTGTLIKDLVATVERAELGLLSKRIADEMELRRMFELQAPQMQSEPVLVGAS
jgi:hypothetical protein